MTTALTGMKIKETSLVDRGANGRRILVTKRNERNMADEVKKQADTLRALAGDRLELMQGHLEMIENFETASSDDVQESFWALSDLLWSAREDIVALASAVGLSDEAVEQVDKRAKVAKRAYIAKQEAAQMADTVVKIEFTEDQSAAIAAMQAGEATEEQSAAVMEILSQAADNGGLYPKPEDIESAEGETEDIEQAEEEEVDMAEHADEEEEVITMCKRDEDHAAELQKRDDRIELIEKRMAAEVSKREIAEHVQKCAANWGTILKAADAGPVLKSIQGKLTADEWGFVTKQLDRSENFLKSGILNEIGIEGEDLQPSDANSKLDTIAKRNVSEGISKNYVEGYNKALADNPDLYTDYMNDQEA